MAKTKARFDDRIFNEEGKQSKEIIMRDMFKIELKTVTPLTQMDSTGKQRKRYVYMDGVNFEVPFFSASGFRGISRRISTLDMYNHIIAKHPEFSMGLEEFYLYTSGAATDKKSIENVTWQTEGKVREYSPILSLWGGGLSAISGKIAMCDMTPSKSMFRTYTDGKGIERGASLMDSQVFFRGDDLSKDSFTGIMVDKKDAKAWLERQKEKIDASKEKVKAAVESGSGDKKELKNDAVNIQMPVEVDSIAPETTLSTSINTISGKVLTPVEKGLLLKTLIVLSSMQIGANTRYGYGVLDWSVELDGETAFTSIVDPDYVFDRKIVISGKAQASIDTYEEWARENYTDQIDIDSILAR